MITFYGIRTCDTCRKAMKTLDAAGRAYNFVDLRADADMTALAPRWIAAVGADTLVNRKSTTWRSLSDADKAKAASDAGAADLLAAHPTLVKRPVIETGGEVFVGWTGEVQKKVGV
ncbi:ArsC family transcriptional regulator [Hyphobacterium sp. SN044]|uniref:ArsC/Spx/MgsR family protein n=1 Tax=Hyphobacterium sp. SN044 TaxID=2912575 RepID=UPI001F46E1B5|nr:ArsC/Spx/MgsR family protein [Hyphobacterium sp. SN044]MCF8880754.1 ArsC family transcriptional regulator [Hyphobacterium sp. SN044]